ncbi:hypothetical protein JRQ81_007325 [Phrynocephalus forsythii]|uniref:Uncharacterized protein n=1 Tax=Phrynocephalus forsythii TaxID=171643 RepID=A0A9Q0XCY8_9SAUR|nr:hypothetical protein JRQ81_007325 [Phrynocephalus forsythii]
MEEMKATIELLRHEKVNLLQKLHATKEGLELADQEKKSMKRQIEIFLDERDVMTQNMVRLSKTIEKTVTANLELQQLFRGTSKFSKGCQEILLESRSAALDKSTQLPEGQDRTAPSIEELKQQLEQLTLALDQEAGEKERLLAESREKTECLQKAAKKYDRLKKIMDNCWNTVMSLRMENDCHRCSLLLTLEKEVMSKLSTMEKKKEYIASVACNLKAELERLKAVVTKGRARVSHTQAAQIRRLQKQYEQISNDLCCLLYDVKYYFFDWFKECSDYYVNISRSTMDLLEMNIKQLKLLMQIQNLRRMDQNGDDLEEIVIPALRGRLDSFLESILEDMSALEEELMEIEANVQEVERSREERKRYLPKCTGTFSMQEFEKGIGYDMEKLQCIVDVLKPIAQAQLDEAEALEEEEEHSHSSTC